MKRRIVQSICLVLVIFSCTPDEIRIPSNDSDKVLSQSNAIVCLFNEVRNNNLLLDDLCFAFIYPLSLQSESGVIIEIINEEGLSDLIQNESSGFFIDKMKFPMSVMVSGESENIVNEEGLQELLDDCGIVQLPELLGIYDNECLDLEYPIQITLDDVLYEIDDFEALQSTLESNETATLLSFDFPLLREDGASLANEYELFEVLNECQSCPDLLFSAAHDDNDDLILSVDTTEISPFDWYINDQFIKQGGLGVNGDLSLNLTQEVGAPGTYEVCLYAAYAYCEDLLETCRTVSIEEDCPTNFGFEISSEEPDDAANTVAYDFEIPPNVDLRPGATISWLVNDVTVQSGPAPTQRLLAAAFENGTYEICAIYEDDFCTQVTSFCVEEQIMIDNCLDLEFASENTGGLTYQFTADFEGMDTVGRYAWYIDDTEIEVEGTQVSGDNQLSYTFDAMKTYQVCIRKDASTDCTEGSEYCEEIEIM